MDTRDLLVVIDMQNDFITGALGTKEAQAIVPKVKAKIDELCRTGSRYCLPATPITKIIWILRKASTCR